MTAPSHFVRAPLLPLVTTTVAWSVTTACAGLSLGGHAGTTPTTASPAPAGQHHGTAPQATAKPATGEHEAASPDATAFVGLTEEASMENARRLKEELRSGSIARIFDEHALVDEVTAICGAKIWDQCQVARSNEANKLGWSVWTFKRKDAERLYRYPDMFYAKAEPRWAALAVEYILQSDSGPILARMTQDKCGKRLDEGCEVRQRSRGGYVLTVRRGGEVIHVMDTLTQWRRDL